MYTFFVVTFLGEYRLKREKSFNRDSKINDLNQSEYSPGTKVKIHTKFKVVRINFSTLFLFLWDNLCNTEWQLKQFARQIPCVSIAEKRLSKRRNARIAKSTIIRVVLIKKHAVTGEKLKPQMNKKIA